MIVSNSTTPSKAPSLGARRTSSTPDTAGLKGEQFTPSSLEHPDLEIARNRRPVVIIHGTMVKKDTIEAYRDFALKEGHPVDFRNYPTVTDGSPIEESAQLVSQNINRARQEIARDNLIHLENADSKEWKQFFHIDGNLYGKPDPKADKVLDQVPWLLGAVGSAVRLPEETVEQEFSSRMKLVESELSQRLEAVSGWSAEQRNKVAGEMVDSLAPKATLVGHSAGGFVAYTVAVNPSRPGQAHDKFSYDGGLGVANVVVLSSPIGEGMSEPLPPAMADMAFYNAEKDYLRPLEALPVSQLAMMNPITAMSYSMLKSATKAAWHVSSQLTTAAIAPAIYAQKPGYEQVTGSSNFFKQYLRDKEVPAGVTVVAVTCPDDKMSEEERSHVDDRQPNAHNLSVDLKMAPGELQRERPTWAHVKMSTMPEEFQAQFKQDLLNHPESTVRYLDPANDDGSRYEVLSLLQEHLGEQPGLLEQEGFAAVKQAIQKVAAERLPFTDSPSALAQKILKRR